MRITSLCLLLLVACDSSGTSTDPRFEALATAVEGDIASSNATGASVAVWLDDEVVFVGGFGTADPDGTSPPDEDTRFQIGSDTKKLTAISLLRRVAAGQITLDTTVGEALPDLEMAAAPSFPGTTLRELLSHRSGIVDEAETTSSTTDAGLASYAYGEFASSYYSLVEPGTFYNYANPNFAIAGLIDERLSHRPWADVVETDLFAPLAMTRTIARKSELDDNTAIGNGISIDGDPTIRRTSIENTWESAFVRPAGLVWSTPSDQIRLARFLVEGDAQILDPALLHEVTTPQTPMYPDLTASYGFGLMVDAGISLGNDYYRVPVWAHGGNTLGYTSTFFVLPEQRFAISILSNGRSDDFTQSVVTAIATLVDLPAPSTPPARPFDASQLDALAGTYRAFDASIGDFEIVITRHGDALEISVPVLDENAVPYEHTMTPVTTHVWVGSLGGEAEELSFIETSGHMYLRNRAFVGVRQPPTP
jgi:CubicO group peptidase (beta-lactamase class C family)